MQIAVGGCLAQKDRGTVRQRAGHVDVVFGTHNLGRAPVLLRRAATEGPLVEVFDAPDPDGDPAHGSALAAVRDVPYLAWVTIQMGCDNSCAFCIVPQVRGPEVSRPFEVLVDEVTTLAGRGVTEVTLLGQNVNSYGRDLTHRRPLFAELLRAVGGVDGIRRVRYTSPHPKDLRHETITAMAETPAVCEHLHLPLQSGSNRVLTAMRRGYTAERYLARLAAARAGIADLAVTTDIIVGFPGETEDDFTDTLEVAAAAEYDSAYTFIFSSRPGTRAAAMADDFVPDEVIAERFERLRVVVERSALLRHEARVGRTEEVMVEGPSKRDPAVVSGRTRQNKLVHFSPVGPPPPAGAYATVTITAAAPHHLRGDLVEVTAGPSTAPRIPVSVR
jgi:tRNA-2-methylthio-N6-dimethylallyladenosine synthase